MRKFTRQEIFTAAYLGLKSQDFKVSAVPGQGCKYRHPNGLTVPE